MSNVYLDKSKIAGQNQLVQWINEAGLAEGGRRAALLRKAAELLTHSGSALLPLYVDHVLSFVADKSSDVKKALIAFIEEISKQHCGLLCRAVGPLRQLLLDDTVGVQKRALQACALVYARALAWLADPAANADADVADMKRVWDHLTEIKLCILNLIDSDNEGVRTLSVKFLEEVVVLQSADIADSLLPADIADTRALTDEAEHIFQLLIKFHNSQHISSVNLMGCISSLAGIARRCPLRLSAVVCAFTQLVSALPPTLSTSQLTSVRKHLRVNALALARLPHAAPALPALAALLQDAGLPPAELAKLPRAARPKRQAARVTVEPKRGRVDSPPRVVTSPPAERQIRERLCDVRVVVDLVTATLRTALPDTMPDGFAAAYEPVADSGSDAQIERLARMLHALVCEAPAAPPPAPPLALPAPLTVPPGTPPAVPPPDRERDERDEKLTLKNAVAKLQESTRLTETRAREREPPTPTVPKLKQKVAALRLAELTRPVPVDVRERLVLRAVERILRAETDARIGGAGAVRTKLLATFAAGYGGALRHLVLEHVLAEPAERVELALAWLYEEYAVMQGFSRRAVLSGAPDKHDRHYGALLTSLLARLAERGADALLRRVLCEAPLVTDEAAQLVAALAAERPHLALDALEELCAARPPRAPRYLPALLSLTMEESAETCMGALEALSRVHARCDVTSTTRRAVEKHALLLLGALPLSAPPHHMRATRWSPHLYHRAVAPTQVLLPNNPELVTEMARAYAACTEAEARRALLAAVEAACARAPALAAALSTALAPACPRNAEPLLQRLLQLQLEHEGVSSALVETSRAAFAARPDVRLLLPALPALTANEVLAALGGLVRLPAPVLKDALHRLLTHHRPPMCASEVLVGLHEVEVGGSGGVELKHVIRATALCFAERALFSQAEVGAALLTLAQRPDIPVLLLRTALQALTLYPALQPNVLRLLTALTHKQVWDNKVAWEGWVKCWARCLPAAAPLLAAVPAAARNAPPLSIALLQLPPHLRAALPSDLLPELPAPSPASASAVAPEPLPPGME